ncbi:MAG: hypothetical protein ACM30G_00630 [Micromonosporaceae bacterium]
MKFPYAEVEFTTTGAPHDLAQRDAAVAAVNEAGATDVVLLAHGWNNDMAAARGLYQRLTDQVAAVTARADAGDRRVAVIGLLWPAKQWADEDLIAGGGVGLGDDEAALHTALVDAIDDPVVADRLQALVPALDASATARREFLDLLRSQLPAPPPGDEDPPPSALVAGDAEHVFDVANAPETNPNAPERPGGAAELAGAAGFSLGGFLRAARNLLNTTTYYTMKERAGNVGANGAADLLRTLADRAQPTRRHLVGHSFGARVVAAASAQQATAHSMMLLQGAFSHHGFAADYDGQGHDGLFRHTLTGPQLTGPLLVTHTANDRAVGLAYAIASRLAGQQAAGIGGPDDRYGGIGRNGALRTPEADPPDGQLLEVGGDYQFAPGRVYNLNADAFIADHGAVTGPQVAYALVRGMVS